MDPVLQSIVAAVMERENPEGVFILYIPPADDNSNPEDPNQYMDEDPLVVGGLAPSSGSAPAVNGIVQGTATP